MNNTFGFIGTGNMGGALAKAAAKALEPKGIFLSNKTAAKAENLAKELGCQAVSVDAVAANCGYIFLGVKPQMMKDLLAQIAPILKARVDRFILVTMAAGLTMADIQAMAGGDYPVIRIMPNTPVAVGKGVVMYDATGNVTKEALATFCDSMRFAGLLDPLPEKLIDAGSAVAGCGPAFVSIFAEGLADGAVACGLPRDKALHYAAQMLLGAAEMVLKTGKHPGELKDAVCSPGGTTIEGVRALENGAFRASAMAAVTAAYEKTLKLKK